MHVEFSSQKPRYQIQLQRCNTSCISICMCGRTENVRRSTSRFHHRECTTAYLEIPFEQHLAVGCCRPGGCGENPRLYVVHVVDTHTVLAVELVFLPADHVLDLFSQLCGHTRLSVHNTRVCLCRRISNAARTVIRDHAENDERTGTPRWVWLERAQRRGDGLYIW